MSDLFSESTSEQVLQEILDCLPTNPYALKNLGLQPEKIDFSTLKKQVLELRRKNPSIRIPVDRAWDLREFIYELEQIFEKIFSKLPDSEFIASLRLLREIKQLRGSNSLEAEKYYICSVANLLMSTITQGLHCLAHFYPNYPTRGWSETQRSHKRRVDTLSSLLGCLRDTLTGSQVLHFGVQNLRDLKFSLEQDPETELLLLAIDDRALDILEAVSRQAQINEECQEKQKKRRNYLTLDSQVTKMPRPSFVDVGLETRDKKLRDCCYYTGYYKLGRNGELICLTSSHNPHHEGTHSELEQKCIQYEVLKPRVPLSDLSHDVSAVLTLPESVLTYTESGGLPLPCPFGYAVSGISVKGTLMRVNEYGGYIFYPQEPFSSLTYSLTKDETTKPPFPTGEPYESKINSIKNLPVESLEDLVKLCLQIRFLGGAYCMLPWFKRLIKTIEGSGKNLPSALEALMVFSCEEASRYLSALLNHKGKGNIIAEGVKFSGGKLISSYLHSDLILEIDGQIVALSASDITSPVNRILTESVDQDALDTLYSLIPSLTDDELFEWLQHFRKTIKIGPDPRQIQLESSYTGAPGRSGSFENLGLPLSRADEQHHGLERRRVTRVALQTCQEQVEHFYGNPTPETARACLESIIYVFFELDPSFLGKPLTFGPPSRLKSSDHISSFLPEVYQIIHDLSESGLLSGELGSCLEERGCITAETFYSLLQALGLEEAENLKQKAKYIWMFLSRVDRIPYVGTGLRYELKRGFAKMLEILTFLSKSLEPISNLQELEIGQTSFWYTRSAGSPISVIAAFMLSSFSRGLGYALSEIYARLILSLPREEAIKLMANSLTGSDSIPLIKTLLSNCVNTPLGELIVDRSGKLNDALCSEMSGFIKQGSVWTAMHPHELVTLRDVGFDISGLYDLEELQHYLASVSQQHLIALKVALEYPTFHERVEHIIAALGTVSFETAYNGIYSPILFATRLAVVINSLPNESQDVVKDWIDSILQSRAQEYDIQEVIPGAFQSFEEYFDHLITQYFEQEDAPLEKIHEDLRKLGYLRFSPYPTTSLPKCLIFNTPLSPNLPIEQVFKLGLLDGFHLRRRGAVPDSENQGRFLTFSDPDADLDIREYFPGTPANRINWRASARNYPKLLANYSLTGYPRHPTLRVDMNEMIRRLQNSDLHGTLMFVFELGRQIALISPACVMMVHLYSDYGEMQTHLSPNEVSINSIKISNLIKALHEFANCAVNLPLVRGYQKLFDKQNSEN